MHQYPFQSVNQINLNGSRKSDRRFPYSTEYGITHFNCNQMYIGCINYRYDAFDIFNSFLVYCVYKGR